MCLCSFCGLCVRDQFFCSVCACFLSENGAHREQTLLTHSFPTRRSSELWEYNEKYEQIQLRVTDVQENTARGRAEIVSYLSSKAIKGVGPKTAERIYDKFGEESLDVLDNHPERQIGRAHV